MEKPDEPMMVEKESVVWVAREVSSCWVVAAYWPCCWRHSMPLYLPHSWLLHWPRFVVPPVVVAVAAVVVPENDNRGIREWWWSARVPPLLRFERSSRQPPRPSSKWHDGSTPTLSLVVQNRRHRDCKRLVHTADNDDVFERR